MVLSPLIVKLPSGWKRLDEPVTASVHVMDIMPTFLRLAGAPYPTEYDDHAIQPLEGESFQPVLEGAMWQRERPLFWEHEGNRAVRDGRWKLVSKYPERFGLITNGVSAQEASSCPSAQAAISRRE